MQSPLEQKKGYRIPFGCVIPTAVIAMLCNAIFCVNAINKVIAGPAPQPTQDPLKIQSIALTEAWLSYTQTAMAFSTATPTGTFTATPLPPTVILTLATHLDGNTLFIEGATDLPNRTLIVYEVRNMSSEDVPAEGNAEVLNGNYSVNVDLSGRPAGELEVWIAFQTVLGSDVKQPPEIIARFGELGELLLGNNVTESGPIRRVELTNKLFWQPLTTNTPMPTATIFISILPGNQSTQPPQVEVCSCNGGLDCKDFSTHNQAQACYDYCRSQGYGDVHGIDGNDQDGLACESLP